MKECSRAEHLTSWPKRGVGALSSGSTLLYMYEFINPLRTILGKNLCKGHKQCGTTETLNMLIAMMFIFKYKKMVKYTLFDFLPMNIV